MLLLPILPLVGRSGVIRYAVRWFPVGGFVGGGGSGVPSATRKVLPVAGGFVGGGGSGVPSATLVILVPALSAS